MSDVGVVRKWVIKCIVQVGESAGEIVQYTLGMKGEEGMNNFNSIYRELKRILVFLVIE